MCHLSFWGPQFHSTSWEVVSSPSGDHWSLTKDPRKSNTTVMNRCFWMTIWLNPTTHHPKTERLSQTSIIFLHLSLNTSKLLNIALLSKSHGLPVWRQYQSMIWKNIPVNWGFEISSYEDFFCWIAGFRDFFQIIF